MAFLKKKKEKKGSQAGLAIMNSGIYYLEVSGTGSGWGLSINNYQFVGYQKTAVSQDSLTDHKAVLGAVKELMNKIGSFPCPLSLGFPSRDFMIKNVDMPSMDITMAREAIQWEFDKYFPFSAAEALYDVSSMDAPGTAGADSTHFLVAALRKKKVDQLLLGLRDIGMKLKSMEPNNVATFRAMIRNGPSLGEGYLVLVIYPWAIHLAVGFHDSCLFFRSVPLSQESSMSTEEMTNRVVSESRATINYIKTVFREIKIGSIYLGGDSSIVTQIKEQIGSEMAVSVEIVDPWRIWNVTNAPNEAGESEAVIGLAVRDLE